MPRLLPRLLLCASLLGGGVVAPAVARAQAGSREQGFDEKVVERLKKILEAAPEEGFVLDKLLELYRTYKSADELIREYEARAAADPKSANLKLIVGFLYKAEGRDAEARARFEEARTLDPKNKHARMALASLAEKAGDQKGAIALYEEALAATTDKISREILRKLVALSVAEKDIAKAKDYAKTLAKSDPSNLYLAMELPQALKKAGLYEEAVSALEALLAAAEDGKAKVAILKELGDAYEAKGDDRQALAAYEKALGMTLKGNSARAELRERVVAVYRKNDDVRAYITKLEKEGSKGFEELELLGRLYEEVSENEKAAATLEKAIAAAPKHLEVRERLIRIYDRIGRSDEVIKQYRALIKAAPTDPRWPIALAELLEKKGQREEALKILADMRKRYSSDPSVRSSLSDLYGRWGERDESLKELEALVKLEPKEEAHLIALGEAYWQLERKDDARATWKKLLTIIPEADRASAIYAETLGEHGLFDEAIVAYKAAIEKNPSQEYKKGLASLLERAKRSGEALALWQEIADDKAASRAARREAREHLVTIYKERGELDTRLALAEKAFSATPPDLAAGSFLALGYLQKKDKEKEAVKILEQLAALDPTDPEPLRDLEAIYARTQASEDAVRVLAKLALLEPARAREYYQKISEHLTRLRRDEEALGYAEKALALGPGDAAGYAKLGEIYQKQAKLAEATRAYEKAISLDRRAFEHYVTLAGLYGKQGRHAEAEALWREIVSRSTDDTQIEQAAKQAIILCQDLGTLEVLEKDLLRLFHTPPPRKVYRRMLVELYSDMTWSLIYDLQNGTEVKRAAAKKKLADIGERALLPLSDALSDPEGDQKLEAAELVGYLQNPNGVLPLAALLEEKDVASRILAALSLGRLGDKSAVSALGRALGGGSALVGDASVRAAAAWALGELKSPNAVSFLAKKPDMGLADPSDRVRAFAALALARQGDASVAPELLLRLGDKERFGGVRASAAFALGVLRSKDAVRLLSDRLTGTEQTVVKISAARALGAIGDEAAVPALLVALWDRDLEVSEHAAYALATFGQPLSIPETERLLSSFYNREPKGPDAALDLDKYLTELLPPPPVGKDATALLLRHKEDLRDSLLSALSAKEAGKERRRRALFSLDAGKDLLALGPLLSSEGAVGAEAQAMLAEIVAAATPRLVEILSEPDEREGRLRAASILGKARAEAAVPALSVVLSNAEAHQALRMASAEALGRIGAPEALSTLRGAMKDPSWLVRNCVAKAFGVRGDAAREADLLPLLDDEALIVRETALESLAEIGATALSYPALERAAKDRYNPLLRQKASSALGRASDPRAEGLLATLSSDPDPDVSRAAKAALEQRKKAQP